MAFDHPRPAREDIEALSGISAATVHEAMGRKGAMPFGIKPIYLGMRLCGAAFTVDCPPGDNLTTTRRSSAPGRATCWSWMPRDMSRRGRSAM